MSVSTKRALAGALGHLARLSDDTGLFEHACYAIPRREHGYCLDDVARGLVVLSREPLPEGHGEPAPAAASVNRVLSERYLAFTTHAQAPDGRFHNRLGFDRRWHDEAGEGDWWGRALWGLGTAAARSPFPWVRQGALEAFEASVSIRPPSVRSTAFAALGAAELLAVDPTHQGASTLLADAAGMVGPGESARSGKPGRPGSDWPWPERRLFYANALIPEVLIAAGRHLGDEQAGRRGLELLGWLLAAESGSGRLSPVGTGGWRLGEARPGFDQQPLEAAALADACVSAYEASGDKQWIEGVERAVGWFHGENDAGTPMYDEHTGGGYDGLHAHGPSLNQGAESTLALISTLQQAVRIADTP